MADKLIQIPRRAAPSYKAGYAHDAAESANPNLWDGLKHYYVTGLGVTGKNLFDMAGNYDLVMSGANPGPPTWEVSDRGQVLNIPANTGWPGPVTKGIGTFPLDVSGSTTVLIIGTPTKAVTTSSKVLSGTGGVKIELSSAQYRATWAGLANGWLFTSVTWSVGARYGFFSSWNGGTKQNLIIKDGIETDRHTASTTGTVTPFSSNIYLYNDDGTSEMDDWEIEVLACYSRLLPLTEIRHLYRDPLAPLRLKDRIIGYSTAAVSGGLPAGSMSLMGIGI